MALKPSQSADDGGVFGKQTVAGQSNKIRNQAVNVIQTMRSVGVTGHLCFLPRGQFGVQLIDLFFDFFLQTADFFGNADAVVRAA